MWKTYNDCLSVHNCLRRIGIPIVSKCECCVDGKYEDFNHVLAIGVFARVIWKKCADQSGMRLRLGSWREIVEQWFRRAKGNSHVGSLLGVLPSIVTWKLWNWRCAARMEGKVESLEGTWQSIKFWLGHVAMKLREAK